MKKSMQFLLFLLILSGKTTFSQPTNLVLSPIDPQYNTDAPPQLIKVASSLQEVPSTLGIGYQVKWDNGDGINLNGCTVVWETTYGVMYSGVQYSNPDAKTSTLTTNSSQGYVRWVNAKEYPVEQNGSTTYVARGKIKVTYSGTNCSANGKTATKDVNIRFVGDPGAVTITGYSNPATVTCGAKNITLTVAAAENATNYDWKNVPASWVGSRATTTNSATFQVDAGTEASNLTATARRSNVPGLNTSTSSSVTVKRPLPSITSSTPAIGTPISLCTPQQFVTASATGTNADSYVWTPQNGARINNSASPVTSTSSVQVRAESADGSYTVRAYSTACQVASTNFESRTVFFGPATLDYGYYITNGLQYGMVESEDPPYPNAFCYTGVSMDANANVNYSRLVNKTWTKIAATPSTFPWAPNQWGGVGLTFKAANQSILFSITYGNNCNSTTKYFGFRSVNCFQALTVFPNPSAQDLVTVQLDNVENEEAIPTEISLYSEQSKQPLRTARPVDLFRRKSFKDNNKIEINVKDLPRGTYYLHVNHAKLVNKPVEKIRIVLD